MAAMAGLAIMVAGTAYSAVSARKQGQYQQQVANVNADFAHQQADDILVQGDEEEARLRLTVRRAIGQTRAAYASQGVDVNEGSAADVQSSIAYMGELDAITLRNNAARQAWGYRIQAVNYRMQGNLDRSTGNVSSVSTILGAASNYYGMKGISGGGSRGGGWPSGWKSPWPAGEG